MGSKTSGGQAGDPGEWTSRTKTQKELMFQFQTEGRKKTNVPGQGHQAEDVPLTHECQPFYSLQALN